MIQGLIILFSGALAYMFNPMLQKIFARLLHPPQAGDNADKGEAHG